MTQREDEDPMFWKFVKDEGSRVVALITDKDNKASAYREICEFLVISYVS